jgi:TPR repeat protein
MELDMQYPKTYPSNIEQTADDKEIFETVPIVAKIIRMGDFDSALSDCLLLFDGHDPKIATILGYLYSRRNWSKFDLTKSVEYYEIGARGGISYAHHALGGLLKKSGREAEALDQYIAGAQLGRMECAYNAYFLLKKNKRNEEAVAMQSLAARLGHPLAARDQAFDMLLGKKGFAKIFPGLIQYFSLIPQLIAYANAISRG